MTDLNKEIREASIDYQMENYPMAIGGAAFEKAIRDINVNPSFIAGAEWMKERMIKDAIEGIARLFDEEIWCALDKYTYKDGDKIKIIILKDNGKD